MASVPTSTATAAAGGVDERLFNELEQRYVSLRAEADLLVVDRDMVKAKLSSLQAAHHEAEAVADKLRAEAAERDAQLRMRELALREAEASQEELHASLKRKTEESDRLRDDMKTQSEQLLSLQAKLKESQVALAEVQGRELPMQYDLLKAQREVENLQARLELAEAEAASRTSELQAERSSAAALRLELSQKLDSATYSAGSLETKLKAAMQSRDALDAKYVESLNEVRELKILLGEKESKFSTELDAMRRQTQLYTRYFEENTETIKQLEETIASMRTAHAAQVTVLRDKVRAAAESAEASATAAREQSEATITELRATVTALEARLASVGAGAAGPRGVAVVGSDEMELSSAASMTIAEFQALGITEMYSKVVDTERALVQERKRALDLEYYLERVHKEVESKAPLIEQQRRDYRRVLESHDRLAKRLDSAIAENNELKAKREEEVRACEDAMNNAAALEQQNKDLADQIQHLLHSQFQKTHGHGLMARSDTPSKATNAIKSADDIISEHLLTFDDIMELQTRNMQLVKVIRKLSADQEHAVNKMNAMQQQGYSASGQMSLDAALKELHDLREARQRTEEMMGTLVQQRDVLRAMLQESDQGKSGQVLAIMPAHANAPGTPAGTPARLPMSSPASRQMESRLSELHEENARLKDRCSRLETAEQSVSEAYERTKSELFNARLECAKAVAESKFQSERTVSLEEARKLLQQELESTVLRCRELEGFVVAQQREASTRESLATAAEERTRAALERVRRLEVEIEVMAAAEKRAMSQLADAREEVRRQAALTESVSRIEAGLFARAEEERSAAARERDSNIKALEDARKEAADTALVSNQKIMALEEQVESLRRRYEESLKESSELKQEVGRLSGLSQASQDRAALLERQLNFAQERLSSITGATSMNAIRTEDAASKEVQLERALLEIESLKSQLVAAEQHADQFRKIGASTEAMLKDLQARTNSSRVELESKVASLQAELDVARAESSERLSAALKSEEEISNIQSQMRELEKQHSMALASSAEEVRQAQALADQAVAQMNILKMDTESFQQAARAAQSNYDRELQLHAAAAARARDSEATLESLRVQLAVANQKITDITSDAIRREKLSEEHIKTARADLETLREEKENLQKINDRLHSEIQALGVQVDRFQNSRAAAAMGDNTAAEGSTVSSEGDSELSSLKSSLSELREVMRYMKRERDLLEARVAVADTENARHVGTIAALQRSLDETRTELKKELENKTKGTGSRSEEEFHRLMAEVTQINIVRESNAHMRRENEELAKKVASLTSELASAKQSIAPLNEQLRKQEATIASLSAERDSLATDSKYWKERMHTLVSRYNDVDPEAHRLLANKLEEAEAQGKTLKADAERLAAQNSVDLATIEKLRSDLETANKELESNKSLTESSNKTAELLRTRLRDFNKVNREMKQQIETLTSDLEAAKTAAAQATAAAAAAAQVTVAPAPAATQPPVTAPQTSAPPSNPPATTAQVIPQSAAAPAAAAPTPVRPPLPPSAPPAAAIAPPLPPTRPPKRPLEEPATEAAATESTPAAAIAPPKSSAEDTLREQLLMRRQQKAAKAAETAKGVQPAKAEGAGVAAAPAAVPPAPAQKVLKKARVAPPAAPATTETPVPQAAVAVTEEAVTITAGATTVEETPMEIEKPSEEPAQQEIVVQEPAVTSVEATEEATVPVPAAHIAPTLIFGRGRTPAPVTPSEVAVAAESSAPAPAPKLTFGAFAAAAQSQTDASASSEQPSEPAKTSFAAFGQTKLNPFAAAFQAAGATPAAAPAAEAQTSMLFKPATASTPIFGKFGSSGTSEPVFGSKAKPVKLTVEPIAEEPLEMAETGEMEEGAVAAPPSGAARTEASPFLDLKAPASPKTTVPLKFGSFGGGSTESAVVFKLPKSASAESLSSVSSASVPSTPVSLFGKPLQQATPGGQAPLSLFGFGNAAASASAPAIASAEGAPSGGLFGAKKTESAAPKFGGVFGNLAARPAQTTAVAAAPADESAEAPASAAAGAVEGQEEEGSQLAAPKTPSAPTKTTPSRPVVLSGGLTAQQRLERRMQKFSNKAAAAGGASSPQQQQEGAESAPPADEDEGDV